MNRSGFNYCKLLLFTVIILIIVMILAVVAFWSLLFTYGVLTHTCRTLGNISTV